MSCPTLVSYGTRVASKHVTDLLLSALNAITNQRRAPALALQGVELCVEGGDAGAAALSQGDHAEDRTVGGHGGVRRAQQAGQQRVRDRALARLEVRAETLISRDMGSPEVSG